MTATAASLARRLRALEATLAAGDITVTILGGVGSGDPAHATAGQQTWYRLEDETWLAFKSRVRAGASGTVIFGGLPTLGVTSAVCFS
jgi:hypothetical protein